MANIWTPEKERKALTNALNHMTQSDVIMFYILQEQKRLGRQLTGEEIVGLFKNRSVCPKCERIQLMEYSGKGEMFECPYCGTKSEQYSLLEYIKNKDYK